MRTSTRKINNTLGKQIRTTLSLAISDLDGIKETEKFMSDFLTEDEYDNFAKRLAVGYWLKKGRSYANIKENLKVSSATIAEVTKMMDKPGFKLILKKVEAEEWSTKWAQRIKKIIK